MTTALTVAEVDEIRRRVDAGEKKNDLAKEFNVSASTLSSWTRKHANGDYRTAEPQPRRNTVRIAVDAPLCNVCTGNLDVDGVCKACGASGEAAWTPPPGYERPITDAELRKAIGNRAGGLRFTQEEVWELRAAWRRNPEPFTHFAKKHDMSKSLAGDILRGLRNYKGM